ncbi:MAG TPA: hypothetical protein DCG47_01380, partial [Spirochaetaceae bacterium]|nr:hypothetical protein [Spirochaetaceae bacterium]
SEPSAVEAPTTPSAAETAAQDENATLREAIFSLDAQLSEQKELSRALAVSLADVGEEHRRRVRALEAELALRNERVRNLTVQLSLLIDAKQLAIDKLKGQASASSLEGSYPLDLNAKALMRALASAPEARAQYPELLASIDRYFDEYGRLERARGRAEAYAEAALTLDSLME